MSTAMVGAEPLLKASMKHDIRSIVPWVAGITVLSLTSIIAYWVLLSDEESQAEFIAAVDANPAFNLIFGQARDLTTIEGFGAWRSLALGGFFAALMAILIVVRNSRANEDSGQAELIASAVVGRSTRLGVAIIMAVIAAVAAGVLSSVAMILMGAEAASSITLAATFTASGLMFAGVAAVTSQIGSDARTASSLAIGVLGGFFLLRGYVDTVDPDGWAVWLSPLGWTEQVAPGTQNNWWPLLACLGLAASLIALAFVLQSRRDFGQGLITPKPGPEHGGFMANIWGLSLRINRGAIVSWTIAFVVLGLVFGMLSTAMMDILEDNPAIAAVLASGAATPQTLSFGLLITLINLLVIIAAVYGVGVANRIYAEEVEYRVEPLLAGAVGRSRYFASNVLIATFGPAIALMVGALAIGLVAASANESVSVDSVLQQGLAEIPALWLLVGIALATIGANPTLRLLAWLAIVATFGLTILGPSLELPDRILEISPLWHVPNVAAANPDYLGVFVVATIAAILIAIGFIGFRRRDIS
jgi:ABC-2 type transport system permease protein